MRHNLIAPHICGRHCKSYKHDKNLVECQKGTCGREQFVANGQQHNKVYIYNPAIRMGNGRATPAAKTMPRGSIGECNVLEV